MYIDIYARIHVVYDVDRYLVPSIYSAQRRDSDMSESEHVHALYRTRAPARKSTPKRERDLHTHCNASVCCSVLQCVAVCVQFVLQCVLFVQHVYSHCTWCDARVYVHTYMCLMHWFILCLMTWSHCVWCTGPYIVSDALVPLCLMQWSHCVWCTDPGASSYSKL